MNKRYILAIVALSVISLTALTRQISYPYPKKAEICEPMLGERIVELRNEIQRIRNRMMVSRYTPEGYQHIQKVLKDKKNELLRLEAQARICVTPS